MKRSLPFLYLGVNVACALVVLVADYRVTAFIAAEHRDYSDGVDGITFFAMSAPALALACLTNVAWASKSLADVWRRRGYKPFAWLGTVAAVWIWSIVIARYL